ncbi:MAG: hypothetical protein O3A71_10605, partial [Proteobacteria bacterium]|nr:hypothetical protein [Pseudomonadota bacterium]
NDVLTGNAAKDSIDGGAGADIISGGLGVDTLTVGTGRDIVKFASTAGTSTDSGTAAFDTVTGFNTATAAIASVDLSSDANIIASTAGGANLSTLSIDADAAGGDQLLAVEANGTGAGVVAGVTYTVKNGILTLSGAAASSIDTLGEWQTEAAAVAATLGDILAFEFSGNTYVFAENGAADVFVSLVGVTGATSLVETSNATTAAIGAILYSDVA